jgi:hypothetical protein
MHVDYDEDFEDLDCQMTDDGTCQLAGTEE